MKDKKNKLSKGRKWLFWLPRILSILFIVFISMFALDIFEMNLGFFGTIVGLFMHLLPSIFLTIILIVGWKRGIIPGVTFILAGIFYIVMLLINTELEWYMLSWSLTIAGPAFVIGILFIWDWVLRKKK